MVGTSGRSTRGRDGWGGWWLGVRIPVADAVRNLSPKARFALSLALVATILLGIATFLLRPSATLRLVCRHDFRKADLTVSIDGEVVHTETITGAVVRKWLGAVERTQGTYTGTFPVSSGTHEVKHAGAILLTIFGSILSASVGVAVQEFLRSRAGRGTVPPPSRPPS